MKGLLVLEVEWAAPEEIDIAASVGAVATFRAGDETDRFTLEDELLSSAHEAHSI